MHNEVKSSYLISLIKLTVTLNILINFKKTIILSFMLECFLEYET